MALVFESDLAYIQPHTMNKRIRRAYRSLPEYRDAAGLTQRDAAAKFGVSQSYWAKLELGKRHPRPKLAQLLMQETGVPLETLLGIAS